MLSGSTVDNDGFGAASCTKVLRKEILKLLTKPLTESRFKDFVKLLELHVVYAEKFVSCAQI
jgi:hypothetical protein